MTTERIEVTRLIESESSAIFEILSSPQGHVAIDSSGMLLSADGAPVTAVGQTFIVHMDREALNDYPLGKYDVVATTAQSPLTVVSADAVAGTPTTLSTSGGSGTGALSYSLGSPSGTTCSLLGASLVSTSPGQCTVSATKAADAVFAAASSPPVTVVFRAAIVTKVWTIPHPVVLGFARSSSSLSRSTRAVLRALARKWERGASVTLQGYALHDRSLALARARAVARFVARLVKVHVRYRPVTSAAVRRVRIVTTRQ